MDDGFPSTFPCPYWRTDTKPEAKSNSFTVFSLIQGEPFYLTLFFPLCHKAMLVNCLINRFVVRRLNAVEGWRPCLCRSAVAPSSACPDDWTELWDVEGSGYSPTFSWTFLLDCFGLHDYCLTNLFTEWLRLCWNQNTHKLWQVS